MKAIILISSIFYILGLKISNKIDFVKKSNPVDKIISHKIITNQPSKTFFFTLDMKSDEDSLKSEGVIDTDVPKCK